jgi:hypothetical protein
MAEHPIVEQYIQASDISEKYFSILKAGILNKGFVGRETNKKTIDEIVNFLHSDEVAEMIKKSLGTRGKNLSNEEILSRYGLPKWQIEEQFSGYKSISSNVLESLVDEFSNRLHQELTSHHEAELANLAYTKGTKAAQGVLTELYRVSGGDKYALAHKKSIESLVTPEKMQTHVRGLYTRRVLHSKRHENRELETKPAYDKAS